MPKSKRAKLVALTQTSKKTREHKSSIIQDVRRAIDEHDTLYLFSYENMRSNKFKAIRMHFRNQGSDPSSAKSRIFLGKNKLLQIAMGRTPEDEYADNLRHVSKLITGTVGLLFTCQPASKVEQYFAELDEQDYARAGSTSDRNVLITNDMLSTYPTSMMEQFRKLGMPVEIQNGRVVLVPGRDEYVVCNEGETLSAEACKILVHFGIKLAAFRVKMVCRWSRESGKFDMLS